jgi:hypothetical protein
MAGRRTLLTPARIKKIGDAIAIGSSYDLAAKYAGISTPTIENWLAKARKLQARLDAGEKMKGWTTYEKRLVEFLREVEDASADAGIGWQKVVDKTSKIDAAMALHMLNLRFSGYSARAPVQLTASIDLSRFDLTEAQLNHIISNGLTEDQIIRLNSGESPANIIPGADPSAGAPAEDETAESGNDNPDGG